MKLAEISEVEMKEAHLSPGMLAFTKLHGNGNDFILIDEVHRERVPEFSKGNFAIHCCHRNFGVGGDGVLFLSGSIQADLSMRLLQPDGSEAEMCGNGIRCLAKYAYEAGYVRDSFRVETLAGIIPVQVRDMDDSFWVSVDMGTPRFDRPSIPAQGVGDFLMESMENLEVSAVNTGVPHAVIFVEDLDLPLNDIAPPIRYSEMFPEGANVNFVKLDDTLQVRTYERGIEGETFSCGTGAVASAAVARRLGLVEDEILAETAGGPLIITFEEDRAFMEGPAMTVFSGELSEDFIKEISQG
jgi:diaminopimelate epimerase